MICKTEGVLKNVTKLTGKHLCQSLFFNKVAGESIFFWLFWGYALGKVRQFFFHQLQQMLILKYFHNTWWKSRVFSLLLIVRTEWKGKMHVKIVNCFYLKIPKLANLTNWNIEAVAQTCSVKKMFLEISQNSQENTYAKVSFLIKSKNTFSFLDGCF